MTLDKAATRTLVPSKEATVYMPSPMHTESIKLARTKFARLIQPGDLPEDECLAQADAILLRVGNVTRAHLLKAPKVVAIARNGVGVDNIDKETAVERGVVVMNCPGGNSQAVAELVLTLTLSLLRRVPEATRRIRAGEIIPTISILAPGLWGKTIGLVGMGDIAQQVALIFQQSFGCEILVFSPTSSPDRWTPSHPTDRAIPHTRHASLTTLLPLIDILSIHCPLLPSTHHLIAAPELALMKPTAIVINTARGGIVSEPALLAALKAGELGGAGLDVFEKEPLTWARERELLELDNVIGLPHLGGSTDEVTRVGCCQAVEKLGEYLDGRGARDRVY